MPHKALPRNLMRKAVHDRSIEDFVWACLELACVELKKGNKSETFSGRDIQSFLDHLILMEKDKRERGEKNDLEDTTKNVKEISDWMRQVK